MASASEEENLSSSSAQNDDERALEEMMQRTWEQDQQQEEDGTVTDDELSNEQRDNELPAEQDFTPLVQSAWREEEKTETQWERNVEENFKAEQEHDGDLAAEVIPKQITQSPAPRKLEASLEEEDAGLEPLNKKQPVTAQPKQQRAKVESAKVVEVAQLAVPPAQAPPEFPSRGIYKSLSAKDTAIRERQRQLAATAFLKEKLFPWAQVELERKRATEHNENAKIKAVILAREEERRALRLEREARLVEQRKQAISDYLQAEQDREKQIAQEKAVVRRRIAEMDAKRREREVQRAKLVSMMY